MRQIFLFLTLLGFCLTSYSQTTIKGKVVDKNTNEALPGATVMAKGATGGTSTGIDGTFQLSVPANVTILTVSFIGYKPLDVAAQPNLVVALEPATETIDELVVVGYGVMRKSDLTGSVGKVNVEDLKKVTTIDAAQAIQGRLAGVNVISNSGNPGSGVTIRIRGIGTINGSDPLYVVDGFPVNDISHVAPSDIESMEVLKDASATAIYGSRGANGVILVKTRSGVKNSKTQIMANATVGISEAKKYYDLADATEFAHAYKAAGKTLDIEMVDYVLEQEAAGNRLKGTDWQKEIYRKALIQRYNVSILGGGEKYSYDHGMTYSSEEGIVKGSYLDKLMFHSNNNYELMKNVKVGMNFNYVWYERPGNSDNDFYTGTIPGAFRSDPISTAWDPYTDFYGQVFYSPPTTNPALAIWKNGFNKTTEDRFMANFFLQIDDLGLKGLSFRSQFGKTMAFSKYKGFSPEYYITATQKNDNQTLNESRNDWSNWVNSNYFSYNNILLDKLSVNATLGMEVQASKSEWMNATGYGIPMPEDLRYLSMRTNQDLHGMGGGAGHNRMASAFFRSNFTWDNKYLLTATVRYDGTSRFAKEQRWGWFPSFSAGWNIANEDFMEPTKDILSTLKLRVGWGQVGNEQNAGTFKYLSTVNSGYIYCFNKVAVPGSVQNTLANTELTWETTETLNIGADFGLFNNSLTGTVDYFIRKTKDMVLSKPIPLYAGKGKPMVNAGTMENKGLELSLNYNNSIGDFRYTVGGNISFIKNEITSLAGGEAIYGGSTGRSASITRTMEGRPLAEFFGYKTAGVIKTQEQLDAYKASFTDPSTCKAELGDLWFVDTNKDGVVNSDDRVVLGSGNPDFTGGFNVNLGYKNFDFVLFMNYTYGNEIANAMYQTLYGSRMFEANISKDMAVNSWSPENPNSNVPRLTDSDPNENDKVSDRWIEDGSYLRIKNIQLGYSLPKSISQKFYIQNFRIYAAVDNLYTFTNYSGLDPEVFGLYGDPFYQGVDMVNYPQPRTYSFGINLTF